MHFAGGQWIMLIIGIVFLVLAVLRFVIAKSSSDKADGIVPLFIASLCVVAAIVTAHSKDVTVKWHTAIRRDMSAYGYKLLDSSHNDGTVTLDAKGCRLTFDVVKVSGHYHVTLAMTNGSRAVLLPEQVNSMCPVK